MTILSVLLGSIAAAGSTNITYPTLTHGFPYAVSGSGFGTKPLPAPVAWDNGSITPTVTTSFGPSPIWNDGTLPTTVDIRIANYPEAAMKYRAVPFTRPTINYPVGTVDTPTAITAPNPRTQNILAGSPIGFNNLGYNSGMSVKYPMPPLPYTVMVRWWELMDPSWHYSSGVADNSFTGVVTNGSNVINCGSGASRPYPSGAAVGNYIFSSYFPSGTYITALSASAPWLVTVNQNATSSSSGNVSVIQAGVGGIVTEGSNIITNCSGFQNLNDYLFMSDANGYFAKNTYIVSSSISAGTVTLSAPATSSSPGKVGLVYNDFNYKYFGYGGPAGFYAGYGSGSGGNTEGYIGSRWTAAMPSSNIYSGWNDEGNNSTAYGHNFNPVKPPSVTTPSNGSTNGPSYGHDQNPFYGWLLRTVFMNYAPTNATSGGYFQLYNGDSLVNSLPTSPLVTNFNANTSEILIGGYTRTPSDTNCWRYFSDCFVDVGDGYVYLTNNPSWAASTIREIQPWTSWSDTNINFTVNGGRFADGDLVYIHYRLAPWETQGDSAIHGPFTMASPQPSGSFTPAAGVTASQYSGISTGTLLTVNLPTGVGAKPVANAPFLYYPMETDLSTSPLSRQTVTATPSTDTANGGIRITSNIPTGLGQAGAAFLEPNSNGNKQPFADGGFGNIVNTTGNWFVSIKKFESAWCQNNKRFRFWGSNNGNPNISKNDVYSNDTLSAVDINGGYIINGVQHGPSTGGVALYGRVLPKLNDWNTYETEITSGTVSNFDGKWNRWVNGAAPYSGTTSMNTARWNFICLLYTSPSPRD